MSKKFPFTFVSIIKLGVSAIVGFASGHGIVMLHDRYFEEPEITLKSFYESKSDYHNGEEFLLLLPENINGRWSEQEKSIWQDRVAATWLFRNKRKSKFWSEILKTLDPYFQNSSNLKTVKENGKNLKQADLLPFVKACFDLSKMVLDNPDHPDSWEKKSSEAVYGDTLNNPNIYMKDSWVACSFKGTIASLDDNWPLYIN